MKSEKTMKHGSAVQIKVLTQIGMLSAIAFVLMLFEIPLWFAPGFYELDLSEVPVLIGSFAIGPMAGVVIELVKILLNLLVGGTSTAGVGEAANFIMGCAFVLPSAIIYQKMKTKKGAMTGMTVGTVVMTLTSCIINLYILLPVYSKALGIPMEGIIAAGSAVNPAITNLNTLVLFAVVPFNLLKGIVVSAMTILLYKKISFILHR